MQGGGGAGWRGQSCLAKQIRATPPFSLGSGAARSEWPGPEPFRPLSSAPPMACLIPGDPGLAWPPQALCCTYSRLVFIPCEDDILFLLSVSVFMCEELLACCACARGELVPRD